MAKENQMQNMSLEEGIARLKEIAETLETDRSITLEQSIELFCTGLGITKDCVNELNDMQARIAELNGQLDVILGGEVDDDD